MADTRSLLRRFLGVVGILLLSACEYEFPESPFPEIRMLPVTSISSDGFTLQMEITKLGDEPIIQHGFLWGIKGEITVNGEEVILGPAVTQGVYKTNVEYKLEENVEYAARSFVRTNSYVYYDAATTVLFSR